MNFCLQSSDMYQLPLLQPHKELIQIQGSEAGQECRFVLEREPEGYLAIRDLERPDLKPLSSFDLIQEWHQRLKSYRGKQEPLSKALGIHKRPLTGPVVDTTAGLGRDSCVMAQSGAKVIMLERELPLALVLSDAIEHAQALDWFELDLELIHAEAADYAASSTLPANTVLYCDPMFNHKSNKSAQNKRLMQFLQHLCHKPSEEDLPSALLAQLQPGQKLIVKKALPDPPLTQHLNYQLKGKNFRFDIHYRPMV
ncbi:MAG TPA: hypothetical protein DHW71_01575 [Gammaproteobacteria bacterium]|nr:hypothetical protein [Gammaproteobacteria bacterium]MBK85197.1 hypothetical protein [Gammaproteobacteria bacterium]MEC8011569.1 class I SAM-dependent methyltransferase [Pseudomonadota bacterium]HCK91642.1 hypothetical protein [Gammaproteobacteria bacterium]